MKIKTAAKLLSLVMTVTLITPVSVYAEDVPVDITADGEEINEEFEDISVNSQESALYVSGLNEGIAGVTAGDVTNESYIGVYAEGCNKGQAHIAVGDVQSGNEDAAYVTTSDGGVATIVAGDMNGGANGAMCWAETGGTTALAAEGNVVGGENGIYMNSTDKGSNSMILVGGDTSGENCGAVLAADKGGVNLASFAGNVTGENDDGLEMFANNESFNGAVVDGNIKSGKDCGVFMEAYNDSGNSLLVTGDVTGGKVGAVLISEDGAESNLVIEGTLRGEVTGLESYYTGQDNASMTVWKIEHGEDGYFAACDTTGEGDYVEDDEVYPLIKYIIKIEQPESGASLRATGADGTELAKVDGLENEWQVAHESDTVLLKVNLEDGYYITGAYGDKGQQVRLLTDEKGDFYVVVPRGGGVYLSVTLDKMGSPANDEQHSCDKPIEGNTWTYASNEAAASLIDFAAEGATVTLPALSGTGLDPAVVQKLLSRRDVTVVLTFIIDGVVYKVTIPAGADLKALQNTSGGIDFTALAKAFGSSEIK